MLLHIEWSKQKKNINLAYWIRVYLVLTMWCLITFKSESTYTGKGYIYTHSVFNYLFYSCYSPFSGIFHLYQGGQHHGGQKPGLALGMGYGTL